MIVLLLGLLMFTLAGAFIGYLIGRETALGGTAAAELLTELRWRVRDQKGRHPGSTTSALDALGVVDTFFSMPPAGGPTT